MPRSYQALEVNTFTKGIMTEASPLTFPDFSAIEIVNFNLNRDGSLSRRYGLEDQGSTINSSSSFTDESALTNLFEWDSAGGIANSRLLVVQDGSIARVFDRTADDIIGSQIGTINLSVSPDTVVTFASVDDYLVTATGNETLIRTTYNGSSLQSQTYRLQIRDVFGVDDGYTRGQGVTTRLTGYSAAHLYNLRNQQWADRRKNANEETTIDPVQAFRSSAGNKYPSNADTVGQGLYSDTNDEDDRVGQRFFPADVVNNPIGVTAASKGYYIIDALRRGEYRLQRVRETESSQGYTDPAHVVSSLPTDRTPNGALVVEEYAGRAFYAGFSGSVVGGDANSPVLNSYVLFSKLVRAPADLSECYSEADPTSIDDPDPVDTDGGFVRIEGAHNITAMRVLQDALYIFAENGVWTLSGGDGGPFSALNMVVKKLTDKGIVSPSSIITTDQSVYYWSENAIYVIGPNQFGDYHPLNLSNTTIQKLYNNITYTDKTNCVGVYDSYEQRILWQYAGNKELILDLNLEAFYRTEFGSSRQVRASFTIPPYKSREITEDVTVNGETVTVNGEAVTVTYEGRSSEVREVAYLTAEELPNGLTTISIATKSADDFRDYGTDDPVGEVITGYSGMGDFQRNKDVPYLTLHFERTEDGLDEDFELTSPSGCLVRTAWDWADSNTSNRWSRQFQGYRLRRAYFPVAGEYDPGFATVVTKNKLRGKGKVLSIHFETEEGKNCVLLGWSYIAGIASNV